MKRSKYIIALKVAFGGLFLAISGMASAQTTAYEYLNANNISARFNADGQLFWDGKAAQFESPKGSGKNTMSAAALWIGGLDKLNILHEAAETYRESGTDFWPGPLDTTNGYTDSTLSNQYNKVWKVTKLEIDSFRAGLSKPNSIFQWPGNGNTLKGISSHMAPFVDLNGNGIYEPAKGEYPDIQGDVMLWWVYNDALGYHAKTQTLPMHIEVQTSAYSYNCPNDPILSNTVFIKYKIINRSGQAYNNVYAGMFADLDIGNIFDDYVGCDSTTNTFFGYNSTDNDRDTVITSKGFSYSYKGYGKHLPAQSVTFLKGINGDNGQEMPMSKFIYYNNEDNSVTGNPKLSASYYNLLTGHWANGNSLTQGNIGYGGTVAANFAFPGKPGDKKIWNEVSSHNTAADRRGLGSFGPFNFNAGDTKEFTVAFGFHMSQSGKTLQSLQLMRDEVRQLTETYKKGALSPCTGISTCQAGDSCVWPGDAGNDGKAYMDDVFRIGLGFGATGPKRSLASADWAPQASKAWSQNFPDGVNYKYADCNGDGIIDSLDIIPISINYANVHSKSGGNGASSTDPVLKVIVDQDTVRAGDVLSGKIILGSAVLPVDNVLGISFSLLSTDTTLLNPGSFQFDISKSDMGTLNDLLALYKQNTVKGQTDITIVRKTKTGQKVKDIIVRWKYVVVDDLAGYHQAEMNIENVKVVDPSLHNISVNTQNATVTVAPMTGIRYIDLSKNISLYPNPAKEIVTLDLSMYGQADIHLFNMQGQEMKTLHSVSNHNKTDINIADLSAGMYIVDITTASGHAVKKFSKIR